MYISAHYIFSFCTVLSIRFTFQWVYHATVMQVYLYNGIPLHGVPLYGIPLHGIPLYGIPLYGIPLYGIPLYGIPLYGIFLKRTV